MNEDGENIWHFQGKDKEWHLESLHEYIFMKDFIYSGIRKQTIPYKDLSNIELLDIWCGKWRDSAERKKVLDHFGRRWLYMKTKKVFENYLKGN